MEELRTAVAGENAEQQEVSSSAGENGKCSTYFGREFYIILTKLNIVLLYDWAIALLHIYPCDLKFYVQKNLYTIIDSSITLNCQNMEATNLSLGKWWIYCDISYNGIPFNNKKEWTIKQSKNVNECILLCKSQHCNAAHSGSIYVTFWEK